MSKTRRNISCERVSKGGWTPFQPNYKLVMELSAREQRRKEEKIKKRNI